MEDTQSDQTFVTPLSKFWNRTPLFWRFQLAGWAAFAAFTFPLKLQFTETVSGALLLSLLRDGSSFLLTLLMRQVYRRLIPASHPSALLLLGIVISLLGGVIQYGFFFAMHEIVPYDDELLFTKSMAFDVFYERTGLLFAWSALYFGIRQIRDGIERDLLLARSESEKRGAELRMLRAQMNPHFLFNALNTIRAGITQDSAISALNGLSGYLRYSLAHRGDDLVAAKDEFDALTDYLAVEKARFREDLELDCQMDLDAQDAAVPGILLQPLVENAIKYGRTTSPLPLRVSIRVFLDGECVGLEVANSGKWIEPSMDSPIGGVGLGNLRRRTRQSAASTVPAFPRPAHV